MKKSNEKMKNKQNVNQDQNTQEDDDQHTTVLQNVQNLSQPKNSPESGSQNEINKNIKEIKKGDSKEEISRIRKKLSLLFEGIPKKKVIQHQSHPHQIDFYQLWKELLTYLECDFDKDKPPGEFKIPFSNNLKN